MLPDVQHIRDVRLERITIAKQPVKFLEPPTRPVHAASYRVGPTTRKFENTEVDELLNDNIIEPVHTTWTLPLVFVPEKDDAFLFCVVYQK